MQYNYPNVMFLDFDGVIFSTRLHTSSGRSGVWSKPDDVAISLIGKLCKDYSIHIVVSSTWGKVYGENGVAALLDTWGLGSFKVADDFLTTPSKPFSRGAQIKAWMEAMSHDLGVKNYMIIDDDPDVLKEQLPFFVRTKMEEGFLYGDYCVAQSIAKAWAV